MKKLTLSIRVFIAAGEHKSCNIRDRQLPLAKLYITTNDKLFYATLAYIRYFISAGCYDNDPCTVRKKDLILRSIERRPQMQFSMLRKFPLWQLRRYSVKYSKVHNFTFNVPCRRKLHSTSRARTSILWICSPPLYHCATFS